MDMYKVFRSRKFVAIFLAVSGLFMGSSFASSSFASSSVFRPTGTTPSLNKVSYISPYIKVSFSKALSSKGVVLESSPRKPNGYSLVRNFSIANKILTINLYGDEEANKRYTITIRSISSLSGEHISNLVFKFTTKKIDFDKLSAAEQKEIIARQDQNQIGSKDPITRYLPHETLTYKLEEFLTSTSTVSHVSLLASLQLSGADIDHTTGKPIISVIEQDKADINAYIKSLGFNPATYDIHYEILLP
jgi:hypothetical protein